MPNTIDGQYILYVLLIFSFLSDIFEKKLTESEKSDMFKRISESSKAKEEYIEIVNFLAYRQSIKPSLITEREEKTGTIL